MRNVTISLDEALVRRAKVEAAKQDKSLSKYIAELVRRELGEVSDGMQHSPEYQAAMEAQLAEKPYLVRDPGTRWLTREEIYEARLRRHEPAALRDRPDSGYETGTGENVD